MGITASEEYHAGQERQKALTFHLQILPIDTVNPCAGARDAG